MAEFRAAMGREDAIWGLLVFSAISDGTKS